MVSGVCFLAPLINSEEAGGVDGNAIWQVLSWLTQHLPNMIHVVDRTVIFVRSHVGIKSPYDLFSCRDALLPSVLFTPEVSPGETRNTKGLVDMSGFGQI